MRNLLRHASALTTGVTTAAVVLKLGLPALSVLVMILLLLWVSGHWVLSDEGRSERAIRMIYAWRREIVGPAPRGSVECQNCAAAPQLAQSKAPADDPF